MPLASYGQTSPQGLEPWSIESQLAPLAVGGSRAEAQNMLGHYQIERDAARGEYESDLANQHQYAYDQLRQQLQENYLKAIPEFAKSNTLGILASAPAYQAAFGGADQGAIADAVQQARVKQAAENLANVGKGDEGLSNAGDRVSGGYLTGLTGAPVTQGENARIAAERIRAGATLGAAAIRAAGDGQIGESIQGTNEFGGVSTFRKPNKMTHQQFITQLQKDHPNMKFVDQPPANEQPPPIIAPPGGGSGSSLAQAPAAQAAPAAQTAPANTAAGVAKMQDLLLANQGKLANVYGPEAAQDIIAGAAKNGGRPQVEPDSTRQSGFRVKGASGRTY